MVTLSSAVDLNPGFVLCTFLFPYTQYALLTAKPKTHHVYWGTT